MSTYLITGSEDAEDSNHKYPYRLHEILAFGSDELYFFVDGLGCVVELRQNINCGHGSYAHKEEAHSLHK
jgi:hypothetical protein